MSKGPRDKIKRSRKWRTRYKIRKRTKNRKNGGREENKEPDLGRARLGEKKNQELNSG